MAQARVVRGTIKTNHTYCPMKFRVINQGKAPVDDYKIVFMFDNENVTFVKDNVEKKMSFPEITYGAISNVSLENGRGVIMYGKSIIPGDLAYSDVFFVRLPDDVCETEIRWRLLSRHYSCDGKLKVLVDKEYVNIVKYDKDKAGETVVGDYIEVEDITD